MEKFWTFIAWRLPRVLARWAFVRVAAHATAGRWERQIVPDLAVMDALQRWDNPEASLPCGDQRDAVVAEAFLSRAVQRFHKSMAARTDRRTDPDRHDLVEAFLAELRDMRGEVCR